MPAPTAQFFTGRMPFLPPNQQHQSTEAISWVTSCISSSVIVHLDQSLSQNARSQAIITIMQRLTRRMSVMRMTNLRRGGHTDLRVAVSVIKRFEFLFESVCSDVQVASDDVR